MHSLMNSRNTSQEESLAQEGFLPDDMPHSSSELALGFQKMARQQSVTHSLFG